jgi:hypothetical protein
MLALDIAGRADIAKVPHLHRSITPCAASREFTPTTTRLIRSTEPSCGTFVITWHDADQMVWASGIRPMTGWASVTVV